MPLGDPNVGAMYLGAIVLGICTLLALLAAGRAIARWYFGRIARALDDRAADRRRRQG